MPLTQTEVAKHYGVSQPSVHGWVRGGCPMTTFEAIDAWREQRRSAEPLTQSDAKLKKILLEVEKLELQVQKEKGELILREEVQEKCLRAGALLMGQLEALAQDLPGQLAGADEATIRERTSARHALLVERFREELANAWAAQS